MEDKVKAMQEFIRTFGDYLQSVVVEKQMEKT